MLKLLLDEHISPRVAAGLQRRQPSLIVVALAAWQGGSYIGEDDSACLLKASAQRLSLVTYDRRTIPPLLKTWGESGRKHGGIVFIDEKTIPPSGIGGLVQALLSLYKEAVKWDWTDRVVFLRR